ncbi:MAG: tetratricopeptide repeat protein [Paucibacter sp.]|nr:tetratricopeptide repeat protein [Roseateles sp.]
MASHLDLEEQEQLEQLKAFWSRWGNLITWVLTAALAAYAGWMGWNRWQDSQAQSAEQIYASLESAYNAGNADPAKIASIWGDLQDKYPRTSYAAQGGLLAARLQFDGGKADDARKSLAWVAEHGNQTSYRDIANLRLAAMALDAKQADVAAKALDAVQGVEFAPLVADRRGDLALLNNKPQDAKAQFEKAYAALEAGSPYKQLLAYKLASLGETVADKDGAKGAAQ